MKRVTLKDFKEHLSAFAEEAAMGTPLEITKHNKPYLYVVKAQAQGLHVGSEFGRAKLRSAGKALVSDKVITKILDEDRDEDS